MKKVMKKILFSSSSCALVAALLSLPASAFSISVKECSVGVSGSSIEAAKAAFAKTCGPQEPKYCGTKISASGFASTNCSTQLPMVFSSRASSSTPTSATASSIVDISSEITKSTTPSSATGNTSSVVSSSGTSTVTACALTAPGDSIATALARFAVRCGPQPVNYCLTKRFSGIGPYTTCSTNNPVIVVPVMPASGTLRLEAEDFARNSDTTPENLGGRYRTGSADIQRTSDIGGGYNIGWTAKGEWLEYDLVTLRDGQYSIQFRTASPFDTSLVSVYVDGEVRLMNQSLPYTAGYQTFGNTTMDMGFLTQGKHTIRVQVENGGFNINWLEILN